MKSATRPCMGKDLWFGRTLIGLLSFALLGGCSSMSETKYRQHLDFAIGKSIDVVVEKWGAPQSTFTMENAISVYTYDSRSSGSSQTTGLTGLGVLTATTTMNYCKISWFVKNNKIDHYLLEGSCESN